jgi:TPR repeat protein
MCAAAPDGRRRGAGSLLGWVALAGIVVTAPVGFAQPVTLRAADSDPAALTARARALENGEGVAKNQLEAAELYCDAARAGDPEAMFALGWMYANGRGVAHDDALAATLFGRAASFGHEQARMMLRFVGPDQGAVPACLLPPVPHAEKAPASVDADPDPLAELPPWKRKIAEIVIRAAPSYGIDPRLALAIVTVESNFQPEARSMKDARGLMQLTGPTAARFNVGNRTDILDNVRGGLAYLQWLLAYYEGRVKLAVAAYNAGEGAVDKYAGVPPYAETRDYVRRVSRLFSSESQPYDPSVVEPSPALGIADSGERLGVQ